MSPSDTARLNGSKSHGPVTAAGKARSAMNALRHGLTAHVRISTESDDQLQDLFHAYVVEWQPRNQVEHDLVEEMVVAKWQQRRIAEIETATLNLEIEKQLAKRTQNAAHDEAAIQALAFQQLAENSKSLALLLRYQASHNRQYHRAMNQLLKLRAKAAFSEPAAEIQNEPTAEPQHAQQNEPTTTPGRANYPILCSTEPEQPIRNEPTPVDAVEPGPADGRRTPDFAG